MGEQQGAIADHLIELESRGDDRWSAPVPAFSDPWAVAGIALVGGGLIDTLAFHQPSGLGLALGLWVSVIAIALIGILMDVRQPASVVWFAVAGIVLAGFVAVRSSPVLIVLDTGAVLLIIAVMSQLRSRDDLSSWTLYRYGRQPIALTADAVSGSVAFVSNDLRGGVSVERRQRMRAVGLGLLLGAPIVVVFTTLFASADVSFDAYLQEVSTVWSFGSILWRTVLTVGTALAIVGVWRTARRPDEAVAEPVPVRATRRLDPRTAMTVLTLLVGLFGLFVLTQVLGNNPDLVTPVDYSRNARHGFFQLLAVAFLVLALLLFLDWLTRSDLAGRVAGFDRLAIVLIGLTAVVMVSAMTRMWLYVSEFGLTELRLYTSVFMVWLGFVLLWFIVTVLQNRHARFAFGVLVSSLVVIGALNIANPDALIVRFNWERHVAGEAFADEYTSTLSADSIPTLVSIVEDHPAERFCFVEKRLRRERVDLPAERAAHGFLADSWSEFSARRALSDVGIGLGEGCE